MAGLQGGFGGAVGGFPESGGFLRGVVGLGFGGGGGTGIGTGLRFDGTGLFELAVEDGDLAGEFADGSFEGPGGAEFDGDVALFLREQRGEPVPLAVEFGGLVLQGLDG